MIYLFVAVANSTRGKPRENH